MTAITHTLSCSAHVNIMAFLWVTWAVESHSRAVNAWTTGLGKVTVLLQCSQ